MALTSSNSRKSGSSGVDRAACSSSATAAYRDVEASATSMSRVVRATSGSRAIIA
ncbi:hypothetical protein FM110_01480 [Brachybacterium nesterenkovii]|uniref:Uncharacterized protein n=1 Tax=Brachybacterium nesterenkovii TaxID=47847 RepID=A0A1X6WTD5_9MICO|nr:hypothetical protein FM110_01480 [Brachybacterium nesterenkovii]